MIIQRKVMFGVLDRPENIYWQDIGNADDDIDLLGYLKGLDDPHDTEYRAIVGGKQLRAIVTQPTEKEVEWLKSK